MSDFSAGLDDTSEKKYPKHDCKCPSAYERGYEEGSLILWSSWGDQEYSHNRVNKPEGNESHSNNLSYSHPAVVVSPGSKLEGERVPFLSNRFNTFLTALPCLKEGKYRKLVSMAYENLGALLAERGFLTQEDWRGITSKGGTTLANLSERFVRSGQISENDWAVGIAEVFGLPLNLELDGIDPELLATIPSDLAFRRLAMPLRRENGSVILAVADPEPEQIYEDFRILTGSRVRVEIAPESLLLQAIRKNYGATVERMAAHLDEGDREEGEPEIDLEVDHDIGNLREMAGEPTVINLVNLILVEAIRDRASDIHIEPFENNIKLRYRIDGLLRELPPPPRHLRLAITSRIKIMAGMNIAERFVPQDGHIKLTLDGKQIDLRVSCCPTVHGESIAMRILDKSSILLDVSDLGLLDDDREIFDTIIHHSHGIFLVTGPTGCGKTTTLYTALNRICSPTLKILTVEDPVEYELEGVCQIPVNVKRGLTFATGLRSLVRQDPDVLMVGEVRDCETAEIAIRAALTGHLVFTTLHTNTAAGAIPRLLDMGVDPYLVSSSLNGILAQRLIRRICEHCRETYEPNAEERILSEGGDIGDSEFFRGAGCEECGGSGYRGRVGIFEIIRMTDEIRELILKRPSVNQIDQLAKIRSYRKDGWLKVARGITTIEEIMRVSEED